MDSSPETSILKTLRYAHRFNFPLTPKELWYWQINTHFSFSQIKDTIFELKAKSRLSITHGLVTLRHKEALVKTRLLRKKISQQKLHLARGVGEYLQKIPTLRAIFITGSLAVKNSHFQDDIDLMLVTTPHTLWSTRLLVVTLLKLQNLRRPPRLPEHSSSQVANKICDNLYLDTHHLKIHRFHAPSLYLAHEVLQATPLIDKETIHFQFLNANSWAANFLPLAYTSQLHKSQYLKAPPPKSPSLISTTFVFLNPLAFIFQYLYMLPHLTHEKTGLGFAFFHPRPHPKITSTPA